jgi:hypothetical protein
MDLTNQSSNTNQDTALQEKCAPCRATGCPISSGISKSDLLPDHNRTAAKDVLTRCDGSEAGV